MTFLQSGALPELLNLPSAEMRRNYVSAIKDKEVDFVAVQGERRINFQICYQLTDQQTIEREYASLKNIDDNFPKYVVSMDDFHLPTNEGIEHIIPWQIKSPNLFWDVEFLLKYSSVFEILLPLRKTLKHD